MATIVATAQADNVPPRVSLAVTSTGATISITRTNANGDVQSVRGVGTGILSGGAWSGYDYECPIGQLVSYTTLSDGGATAGSTQIQLDLPKAWLIHPGLPSASRPIHIAAVGDVTRTIERGVHRPAGRSDAVVVSDRRRSAESSITLYTETLADRDDLLALLDLGAVLLLNVPAATGFDLGVNYISVGDTTEARPVRLLTYNQRLTTLPYVVTTLPVGLELVTFTWADLIMENSSWSTLKVKYSTWGSVATHTEFA